MSIKEKMRLCFNEALETNEILTNNEKKVLASLLYSYKVCRYAKDGVVVRAMDTLREDLRMNTNNMYDAIRNLEKVYGMIERTPGKVRAYGEKSVASHFKLNFQKIFNPPTEPLKFDFSEELKASETSIDRVDIDTVIDKVIDADKEANKDKATGNVIVQELEVVNNIASKAKKDNNNKVPSKKAIKQKSYIEVLEEELLNA
jgi:hypothetical protein